jgi:hypothetical protein
MDNILIKVPQFYRKFHIVVLNGMALYFSYSSIIAFETENGIVISENIWSNTTGRHLNWIDSDKTSRFKNSEFELYLEEELKNHNIDFTPRN